MVFRAGESNDGILLKNDERRVGVGVGLVAAAFQAAVMTDAGEVTAKHAGGDGRAFVREIGNVFLDGGVEIDLTALNHEGKADGGEGF